MSLLTAEEMKYLDDYLDEMGWVISKDGVRYARLKQLVRGLRDAQLTKCQKSEELLREGYEEKARKQDPELKRNVEILLTILGYALLAYNDRRITSKETNLYWDYVTDGICSLLPNVRKQEREETRVNKINRIFWEA